MNEVKLYRRISLLPVISKVFERVFLNGLQPVLIENGVLLDHQFGFHQKHGTVEQAHRIADTIRETMEKK